MFQIWKTRTKKTQEITETVFECKRDDLTIRGTEYRPKGENLPIAIVSHGFMATQGMVSQYAKALAEMGYVSFCFDFCGGSVAKGKSDGKTTDMSVLTEVKDLEAVITYTKSLSYTDSDNIVLMGCSQGGFVSALTAAKLKDEISKLILFYPALCIPDDARAGKMMFAKFDPANVPDIVNCGPMKLGKCYVLDVIGMDPYDEIQGYTGDVLIVHGTDDKIVKLDYAKNAYKAYLSNAESKERNVILEIIDGGQHGFSKKHDKIAIRMISEFLAKN